MAMSGLIKSIYAKPQAFAQITMSLISAIGFVVVAIAWYFYPNSALEVPLIIFGVSLIAMLVLIAKQQLVLIIAILIVGTIVTKTEFLLKMFALASGEAQHVGGDFYGSYKGGDTGSVVSDGRPDMSIFVTDLIRTELEKQGITTDKKKLSMATERIGEILDKVQLTRISERIGGANLPLRKIVAGGDEWKSFLNRYDGKEFFKHDVNKLMDEGLVNCGDGNFVTCVATERGKGLSAFVDQNRRAIFDRDVKSESIEKPIDPQSQGKDK